MTERFVDHTGVVGRLAAEAAQAFRRRPHRIADAVRLLAEDDRGVLERVHDVGRLLQVEPHRDQVLEALGRIGQRQQADLSTGCARRPSRPGYQGRRPPPWRSSRSSRSPTWRRPRWRSLMKFHPRLRNAFPTFAAMSTADSAILAKTFPVRVPHATAPAPAPAKDFPKLLTWSARTFRLPLAWVVLAWTVTTRLAIWRATRCAPRAADPSPIMPAPNGPTSPSAAGRKNGRDGTADVPNSMKRQVPATGRPDRPLRRRRRRYTPWCRPATSSSQSPAAACPSATAPAPGHGRRCAAPRPRPCCWRGRRSGSPSAAGSRRLAARPTP